MAVVGSAWSIENQDGRNLVANTLDVRPVARIGRFDLIKADSLHLKRVCYRLRYQTYCVENAFEDPTAFIDNFEADDYDERSLHGFIVFWPTGMPIGTVRLILPSKNGEPDVPFALFCGQPGIADERDFPFSQMAEISRFSISQQYLRSASQEIDGARPRSDAQGLPQAIVSRDSAIVALIRLFVGFAAESGVQYFCALMQKSLLRRVRGVGIYFDPVGPEIEFHGLRQPSLIKISTMLARVKRERPDVWRAITNDGALAAAFAPGRRAL